MSSKRKWDQPAEGATTTAPVDDTKSANDAAAAAAAIAAKIAAQFAAGGLKDGHEADYQKDIDINDVRNRYVLTKGSTQQEVCMSCYRPHYRAHSFRFTMLPVLQ